MSQVTPGLAGLVHVETLGRSAFAQLVTDGRSGRLHLVTPGGSGGVTCSENPAAVTVNAADPAATAVATPTADAETAIEAEPVPDAIDVAVAAAVT